MCEGKSHPKRSSRVSSQCEVELAKLRAFAGVDEEGELDIRHVKAVDGRLLDHPSFNDV